MAQNLQKRKKAKQKLPNPLTPIGSCRDLRLNTTHALRLSMPLGGGGLRGAENGPGMAREGFKKLLGGGALHSGRIT